MFIQNLKGLITILLIGAFLGTLFFGYKIFIEPKVKGTNPNQFPVDVEEDSLNEENAQKITPQIEIFKDRAIIRFKTPYESEVSVLYDSKKCSLENCKRVDDSKKTEHKLVLGKLEPNTNYFYKLIIDNVTYPQNDDEFFTFITLKDSAKDSNNSKEPKNISSSGKALKNNKPNIPKLDLSTFKEAIKKQDLEFDFNKDGKVNILDYSLYKKSN